MISGLDRSSFVSFETVNHFYTFLNRPPIKENMKKTIGCANLFFTVWETYDLIRRFNKKTLWPAESTYPLRLIVLSARIAIIGMGLSTIPGYQIAGAIASFLLSERTILQWFGPNLNFAATPFHIRHIVSIGSFVLGIPPLLYFLYKTVRCEYGQLRKEYQRLYWINAFTVITSRVTLHAGNAIVRRMLQS